MVWEFTWLDRGLDSPKVNPVTFAAPLNSSSSWDWNDSCPILLLILQSNISGIRFKLPPFSSFNADISASVGDWKVSALLLFLSPVLYASVPFAIVSFRVANSATSREDLNCFTGDPARLNSATFFVVPRNASSSLRARDCDNLSASFLIPISNASAACFRLWILCCRNAASSASPGDWEDLKLSSLKALSYASASAALALVSFNAANSAASRDLNCAVELLRFKYSSSANCFVFRFWTCPRRASSSAASLDLKLWAMGLEIEQSNASATVFRLPIWPFNAANSAAAGEIMGSDFGLVKLKFATFFVIPLNASSSSNAPDWNDSRPSPLLCILASNDSATSFILPLCCFNTANSTSARDRSDSQVLLLLMRLAS